MEIGVPKESVADEQRVALVPDGARKLVEAGHNVSVQSGAGAASFWDDASYEAAGALVVPDATALYARADLVLKIQGPTDDEVQALRRGTALVALLQPVSAPRRMQRLAEAGISAFSLDALPRITRAQSMDVLSSMSTIAGYKAALLGATMLPRFFPLLMTAAGTVTPARVLILGAGVAGLQAIATAKRLGALVQAFDTRPVVREQVESLGASYLTLPLPDEQAEGAGGYARELSDEAYAHERDLLQDPVKESDVIITTALIPGARAPVLITAEMVASMKPGSVIIDLSGGAGGNCELTVPGQRIVAHRVTIDAPLNLPATMPFHASQLFSRNLVNYVTHLLRNGLAVDAAGNVSLSLDDEIVGGTCITHAGQIVHRATLERLKAETVGEKADG